MMDPEMEERYLQVAIENPEMLCSEAPSAILDACSSDAEHTKFLEDFFAAGFSQWILGKYGRRVPQERINNAIIVLWVRACRLHTNQLLGIPDPDLSQPFFSDEGLYETQ